MSLGVLYYIKAQCLRCNSVVLVPCYEDGIQWDRACDMCNSMGTEITGAEFSIQGMADSIGQE